MADTIDLVKEFHDKAGHIEPNCFRVCDEEINNFRLKLIQEEVNELAQAFQEQNLIEIFDALLDLQYVLDGTFIQLGLMPYKQLGFEEVHRSNMTKDFPKKAINIPHKISKGENYSPPDLMHILNLTIKHKKGN